LAAAIIQLSDVIDWLSPMRCVLPVSGATASVACWAYADGMGIQVKQATVTVDARRKDVFLWGISTTFYLVRH
jgi:hypothetical protein